MHKELMALFEIIVFCGLPKLPHNQILSPFKQPKSLTNFRALKINHFCKMHIQTPECTKNYNSRYTEL